ncbi:hypothetical protein AB0M32_09700 [Streptomyces sp. NPDC051985]|uniref:hypothetical protein n=1 Tax=Streptomyces sp. NPDC051985 TaxID=3155807 RepID=UPI0034419A19
MGATGGIGGAHQFPHQHGDVVVGKVRRDLKGDQPTHLLGRHPVRAHRRVRRARGVLIAVAEKTGSLHLSSHPLGDRVERQVAGVLVLDGVGQQPLHHADQLSRPLGARDRAGPPHGQAERHPLVGGQVQAEQAARWHQPLPLPGQLVGWTICPGN